jgi:hypothetical protein
MDSWTAPQLNTMTQMSSPMNVLMARISNQLLASSLKLSWSSVSMASVRKAVEMEISF